MQVADEVVAVFDVGCFSSFSYSHLKEEWFKCLCTCLLEKYHTIQGLHMSAIKRIMPTKTDKMKKGEKPERASCRLRMK